MIKQQSHEITIFWKPFIEHRYDSYEKRLASYVTCDRFPSNSRALQRQFASNGLYLEFASTVLLVCSNCGCFRIIIPTVLCASTAHEHWNCLTYPCKCNESYSIEQQQQNFNRCWPSFTRFFPECLLNPALKDVASRGLILMKFALTKCFCCRHILPYLDSPRSKFCIVGKALREKLTGPLCSQCKMMPVTVRALPCLHVTVCAMCLIGHVKCPQSLCNMNVDCVQFKE
jgi:hypothetical protein